MRNWVWPLILSCTMLGACSTSPHTGRAQFTVPQPLSAVYSEVDMRLQLVSVADAKYQCTESECDARKNFEMQVARLGARLANIAFEAYPKLNERIKQFEFVIAKKSEPGTTSNASGTVVIFLGTRMLDLSDEALAFIIAREMGHVIGRHHDEHTATSILFSALAQVLSPLTSVLRSVALLPGASSTATAASASTSATATASATVTAASFVGSRVAIASYWPKQLREADEIALGMLARMGHDPQSTAAGLKTAEKHLNDSRWANDLLTSSKRLAQTAQAMRQEKEQAARLVATEPLSYGIDQLPAEAAPVLAPPQTRPE